jgi:subtilisin family serine protease
MFLIILKNASRRSMTRKLGPWIGLLLFLSAVLPAVAFDVPREALIEITHPVNLTTDAAGTARSGLPDLDALLSQYKGALTMYALPAAVGRHTNLKRYLLVRLDQSQDEGLPNFLTKVSRLTSVRWAQGNHVLRPSFVPNDPLFSSQWGLAAVHAPAAWDVTKGLAIVGVDTIRIPIAIIDTGCEMNHPDLVPSFWTNPGEIPGNGLDDDNNGFVDDIHGWDFVDAPSFPSSGDYLVRDNDPTDEMGHGTAMAGIAAAAINNAIGVTGLAPDCPLMILRAGNADGYLQEDDVASALLYALDNGARVVNMSFGDTQASPMLEDVINYAGQNGLTMVAASGNFGTNGNIFPAAFGPVLCVGAINQNGARASFSSYGTALDLMAPGVSIVSTLMGGQYGAFQGGSGTSFATAFASAAAGMVLARHPDWDPAMVMSVLKSSCDDLGDPGWDPLTGQGLLRADKAVNVGEALVAQITSPTMGQGFAQTDFLDVLGTAAGVYLQRWWLLSGVGENPAAWDTIVTVKSVQVVNDSLARWQNSQPVDTAYTLRLGVEDLFGNMVDDRVVIYYDPSPPVISNISLVPILDGDRPSFLLRFHTDDLTTGKLWLDPQTGPLLHRISLSLNYVTQDHVLLVGEELGAQLYNYSLSVTNTAGLTDTTDILGSIDLRTASIATNNFVEQLACNLPPGYLYDAATDFDGDGFLEVWQDSLNANFSKESLYVWESATGATFNRLNLNFGKQIPKSIGDSDADGKSELLTLYGGASKLFEATTPGGVPQPGNLVWSDSGDVWGVKLMDLVPGDGHGEVLLEHGGVYQLWANTGTSTLTFLQNLPDPFGGMQTVLPPYCRLGDFDNDGNADVLFGDYYGHLFMYEQDPGTDHFQTTPVWTDTTGLLDTGEFLSSGDWDGDGTPEFACLAHTETVLPGEHLADTRFWALFVFKSTGNNQYAPVDTLYFFGAYSPSTFASGISSGDVIGDARPELILTLYPHLYVLGWDQSAPGFAPQWYYPECRSNKVVIGDFNRDSHADFIFNSGSQTRMFEAFGAWSQYPPPPLNFQVQPSPLPWIHLNWSPVSGALAYNLYRGYQPTSLSFLGEVTFGTDTTDFNVSLDTTYYYAITTVNLQGEGPPTVTLAGTPNALPTIVGDSAHFIWPDFVTMDFSEPMDNSILDPNNYYVYNPQVQLIQPRSIISDQGGKRAILSFGSVFQDSLLYRMLIDTLYDLQGSPLVRSPIDTLHFTPSAAAQTPPYLVTANITSARSVITVGFSQPMNNFDLGVKANYSITADVSAGLTQADSLQIYDIGLLPGLQAVELAIDPNTPLNSLIYRVEVRNVHSLSTGLPIDTTHNAAVINFLMTDLNHVFVAPNPYDPNSGQDYLKFENLTESGEIHIVTVTGVVIREMDYGNGVAVWDLKNERGQKVGSGVYLYFIKSGSQKAWGKFAVVR